MEAIDYPAIIQKSQKDPVWFIETFLDCKLWKKQREIAMAVARDRRVSVASGHDLGKSFLMACLVIWFIYSHPWSKVVTTAVTYQQVRGVLWQEIRRQHIKLENKFTEIGEIFQTELRIAPAWNAEGISPDRPDALQGRHAPSGDQLVVVDEAAGLEAEMMAALEGISTQPRNKLILIGNPTNPLSYFADTHSGKIPGWTRMSMSCYESPNIYIGEDGKHHDHDPLPHPYLVSMEWINEKRQQWGVNSPEYVSRVLGLFPESAEDQLISNRHISSGLTRGMVLRKVFEEMENGERIVTPGQLRDLFGRN